MIQPNPTVQDVLRAIDNGEIKVYYQPQYDVLTDQMASVEALARWQLPDGTVLLPGRFVPLLEQSDAICRLDWYMLEKVCQFLHQQPEEKRRRISVNFSRWHFQEPDFLQRLCGLVDSYELPHQLIGVEITESAAVHFGAEVVQWVNALKDAEFPVAMDDFGSTLSSLSFLKDVPVDVLKLDRNLLSSNCESERERVLLESIITFAHRLNMTTIAEGVETEEQLNFLRTSGCERVQGFLMSYPLPESEFLEKCSESAPKGDDVLARASSVSAMDLLAKAVFQRFPLIILANLSRNSYFAMTCEHFTTHKSPAAGVYDELIARGVPITHPEDRALFTQVFSRDAILAARARGEHSVRAVTRQLGDDGVYRQIETSSIFVSNPSSSDILAIVMSQPVEEVLS